MSTLWSTFGGTDLKRVTAHIFPGFLLFAGLVMAYDYVLPSGQPTVTSYIRDPSRDIATIETVILIGLFVGSILGMMIDGIGHMFFEHKFFGHFLKDIETCETQCFCDWMAKLKISTYTAKPSAYYLYPKLGLDSVSGQDKSESGGAFRVMLLREFYSYYEFYINTAIALLIVSPIIPFYMIGVLNTVRLYGIIALIVVLILSGLLFPAALHTLRDYRENRVALIAGKLRKLEEDEEKERAKLEGQK